MGIEKVDATFLDHNLEPELMNDSKSAPVDKPAEENRGKKDIEPVESSKPPNDAVDEWPAPKQQHFFYFVKYRSYEDTNLKKKIDIVDREIQKRAQERSEITEALRTKRSARAAIIDRLRPLNDEHKRYKEILGEKKKEREPLQASLDEIRNVIGSGRTAVSSKEELDDLIKSLHHRLNHESIPLSEEKRLIKEIKVLEEARGKMITNAPMMAKQDAIKDKVKLIGADMDGVRKEQQEIWVKICRMQEELKPINEEITSLEEELKSVSEKRDKAFQSLLELRKSRDQGNSSYYKNRSLLNNAREIAAKKDISSLGELSVTEIEAFMSTWNTHKATREDYERRILSSLDSRLLSRDGRMRNPDEKPIVAQASQPSEVDTAPLKAQKAKGDVKSVAQHATSSVKKADHKVPSDSGFEKKEKAASVSETAKKESSVSEIAHAEKTIHEVSKSKEIDAAKLKEIRREEEIAKAKLAMERKKRLAEKAAAKAALRAQRDAEKKVKEKEKKAKEKVRASLPDATDEAAEMDIKAVEEDSRFAVDADVAGPVKPKEPIGNVWHRNPSKRLNQIPKAILKRKKSQSYWYWAAAGTSVALLLVAVVWYFSFARNQVS